VREVVNEVERVSGRTVPVREAPRRPGDPTALVTDAGGRERCLGGLPVSLISKPWWGPPCGGARRPQRLGVPRTPPQVQPPPREVRTQLSSSRWTAASR
jgi:hypothetical protein